MSAPTPTAGWYLDPDAPVPLRWFDGQAWTGRRRDALPAELFGDRLPIAPAGGDDDLAEVPRGLRHSGVLLGVSLAAMLVLPLVWIPIMAATSLVYARRAETARRAGTLLTARRCHRAARRWRLAAYWSIPVTFAWALTTAAIAAAQFFAT